MNPTLPPAFPVTNKTLKLSTGFSYRELCEKRAALQEGTDWALVTGRTASERVVCWSQAAAEAVRGEARGPALPEETGGALAGAEAPGARSQEGGGPEKGAGTLPEPDPASMPPEPGKPPVAPPSALAEASEVLVAEKGGGVVLTVAHGPYANRHILDCYGPQGSATDPRTWIRVRVRASDHFLPGMQCRAEPVPGEAAWKFLGPPEKEIGFPRLCYPRARGRW